MTVEAKVLFKDNSERVFQNVLLCPSDVAASLSIESCRDLTGVGPPITVSPPIMLTSGPPPWPCVELELPECPTHGFLGPELVANESCVSCQQPIQMKSLIKRIRIERLTFVMLALILMGLCFSYAAKKPNGQGWFLPWEKGANSWSALSLAMAFIAFGYAAVTFLSGNPKAFWVQYMDRRTVDIAAIPVFSIRRFLLEGFVSLVISGLTFAGWLVYVTVASRGEAWK
jgi:hypothetical protein